MLEDSVGVFSAEPLGQSPGELTSGGQGIPKRRNSQQPHSQPWLPTESPVKIFKNAHTSAPLLLILTSSARDGQVF